ncbi:hypothetical protein QR680_012458 [Steinernema hermaphroditum]|uniref:SET domain-containing protein n=1 Tax=Steinernema hermaphroditum TaxID=289476 RepID=A0AA39I236_9BILA|nr:hypothetical protein QR680_012458 [Steinernema hermaphroditum]
MDDSNLTPQEVAEKAGELMSDVFGNAEIKRALELSNRYIAFASRRQKMNRIITEMLYNESADFVKQTKDWLRHWYIVGRRHFSTTGETNLTQANRVLKRYKSGKKIDEIATDMNLPKEHIVKILTEPLWNLNDTNSVDIIDLLLSVGLHKEPLMAFECFLRHETMLPLDWIIQISGHNITEILIITTFYRLLLEAPLRGNPTLEYFDSLQLSPEEFQRCCDENAASALREVSRAMGVKLDDTDWTAKYLEEENILVGRVAKKTAAALASFEALCDSLNDMQSTSPYKPRIGRIQNTNSQQEAKLKESLGSLRRSEDVYDNDPDLQFLETKVNDKPIITKEEMEQLTVPTNDSPLLIRANDSPGTHFTTGNLVFRGDKECRVKTTSGQILNLPPNCIAIDKESGGILRVGTRVAARYSASKIYNPKPKGGWYSGTIISRMAPRYVVVFDSGFAADLFHDQVRLQLEQPKFELCPSHSANKSKRASAHGKCKDHDKTLCDGAYFLNAKKAYEFLRKDNDIRFFLGAYMESFPHWELVKMKNSPKILRVNCINKKGKNDSAYMLHTDYHTCLLRFPKDANDKCTKMMCEEHAHDDEWIYRGSPRLFSIHEERKLFEQFKRKDLGLDPLAEKDSPVAATARRRLRATRSTAIEAAGNEEGRSFAEPRPLQMARKTGRLPVTERITKKRSSKPSREELRVINEAKERTQKNDIRMTVVDVIDWTDRYKLFSMHADCSSECLRGLRHSDPADVKYHEMSPYLIPLMNGWTRARICLPPKPTRREKYRKLMIIYQAPCGKYFKQIKDIATFLRATNSILTIDLFTFDQAMCPRKYARPNPEFLKSDDFAQHMENIKIPVVNSTHPEEDLPTHAYCRLSVPGKLNENDTEGTYMPSVSKEFCSGCTCEDDCYDAERCECQLLTKESIERLSETLRPEQIGYNHRLRGDWSAVGVYECNANCRCHRNRESKRKCYNTVVQQDIKFPLMLFRTPECGWGVRTLVDIPEGAFVSNYAGEIFNDEQADILKRDAYYADLDLSANFEYQKLVQGIDNIEEAPTAKKSRSSKAVDPAQHHVKFTLEDYFGEGEDLYIVDAFVRGNIGKFYNHSCKPNMQVQHVIVDSHDVRFPWVSFFATRLIRAGEELTWNYGYEVGKVANRFLFCKCGERECKGRIL